MDYNNSFNILRDLLQEKDITEHEWNEFAHENALLSSIVMKDRFKAKTFDELKNKVKKMRVEKEPEKIDDKMQLRIERLRSELHDSIINKGVNHKDTYKLSAKMDYLINKYYLKKHDKFYPQNSVMYDHYKKSYMGLKNMSIQMGSFPSIEEWNEYAKQNACLSSVSLQYISNLSWHELRNKIAHFF